jgi:hypothetical protein
MREIRGSIRNILEKMRNADEKEYMEYSSLIGSIMSPISRYKMQYFTVNFDYRRNKYEDFLDHHYKKLTEAMNWETSNIGRYVRWIFRLQKLSMDESMEIVEKGE